MQTNPLDREEGLKKIMSDMSVKEIEFVTITDKLKYSE